MDELRHCTACKERKALSEFPKNKACSQGRTRVCRKCTSASSRRWVANVGKKNPNFVANRLLSQEKDRAKRYGLTLEELEAMKVKSAGKCEVCENPPSGRGTSGKSLHIDHCHSTGKIRGMLCARCNLTLGRFGDDSNLLRKLAEYLERSRSV